MKKDDRYYFAHELLDALYVEKKTCNFNLLEGYSRILKKNIIIRFAGRKAIDIYLTHSGISEPTKAEALSKIIDCDEANVLFFGDDVGKNGRDSSFYDNPKTKNVITFGVGTGNSANGVIMLKDYFKFIKTEECNTHRLEKCLRMLLYEMDKDRNNFLNILYTTFSDPKIAFHKDNQDVFAFDVDNTLVEHLKNDMNRRETLNDHLCFLLLKLMNVGIKVVILTDNSYFYAMEKVIKPLLNMNNHSSFKIPLTLVSNGMTSFHEIYNEHDIIEYKKLSCEYKISKADLKVFDEILGKITEDSEGNVHCQGIVGKYYMKIMDNKTNPCYPDEKGYISKNYPKFQITNSLITEHGNFMPIKVEYRTLPISKIVTEISVKTIFSYYFMED